MMQQIVLFVFAFCCGGFACQAQDDEMKALLQQLKAGKEDTNRINILHEIQNSYLDVDNDTALYYNKQAEGLIDKLKAESQRHRCYHAFVKIYHAKFDNEKALEYCLKGIDAGKRGNNLFQQATSYRALFSIYYNLRKKDSAIKYGAYAVDLTEKIKDSNNIATMYGNLCRIYQGMELYEKGIEFGKKGIADGERYNDYKGMLISMNNVGNCYISLSRYKDAIVIFEKQLLAGQKYKRIRSVFNALLNLGSCYYNIVDKENLHRIANQMRSMQSTFDEADKAGTSFMYSVYGYDAMFQKKYPEAEKEMLTGLAIAEKDSVTSSMETLYLALSTLKYCQQDFKAANYYDEKWSALDKSLRNKEISEYALDLETKYQTENKIAKIKLQESELKEKSIINYILIGGAAALAVISLLLFINYRHQQNLQQQRISELETEKQLTATEAVLQGEEQERSRLARDLHDGLGGMLSGIKYSFNAMKGNLIMTPENAQAFERSMDMLDSSIKEMRRVAHNMMPEALVKFGLDAALKDFCNDINQSGALQVSYQSIGMGNADIHQTVSITVYRIVQELINNSIKHAAAKTVIVQLAKENDQLNITVEDDGIGFDVSSLYVAKGIGWINIQNRVELLKGKLDVQSQPGAGTSVFIEIKT
ncbi:MAG: sensor histidine kinase [Rhizobacter sp.]|nr:sensor histidine kinase [Ferruginibacter sp.]